MLSCGRTFSLFSLVSICCHSLTVGMGVVWQHMGNSVNFILVKGLRKIVYVPFIWSSFQTSSPSSGQKVQDNLTLINLCYLIKSISSWFVPLYHTFDVVFGALSVYLFLFVFVGLLIHRARVQHDDELHRVFMIIKQQKCPCFSSYLLGCLRSSHVLAVFFPFPPIWGIIVQYVSQMGFSVMIMVNSHSTRYQCVTIYKYIQTKTKSHLQ